MIDHFAAKGVPLGEATVKYIVSNTTGPINDAVNTLEAKLIESKYFNDGDITSTNLAAAQWAKGDLLDNADTNLNNFTYVGSMQNLGMSFASTPEAAYNEACNPGLDMSQAVGLLN